MKKQLIIFLAKHKVTAVKAWVKRKSITKTELFEAELKNEDDLYDFLISIKKKAKLAEARLLLAQDLIFVDLIKWPEDQEFSKESLVEKVKTLIPTEVDNELLKWQERKVSKEEDEEKEKLIQFLLINNEYWQKAESSFKKADFRIINFEPSLAPLLRMTREHQEAHLVRMGGERLVLHQGILYASARIIEGNDAKKEEKALTDYVKDKWDLDVGTIVNADLSNIINVCFFQDEFCCQDNNIKLEHRGYWSFFFIIFFVYALISVFIYWKQIISFVNINFGNKQEVIKINETVNLEKQAVVEEINEEMDLASESADLSFDRSQINILIENGTGESGLAATYETELVKMGYEEDLIELANADKDSYKSSVLKTNQEKAEIADLLYADFQDKIDLEVKIVTSEELEDFDAIIIIGKKGESIDEKN